MSDTIPNQLEIHNLTVQRGDADVVHEVNLTVPAGEIIGLIGPNGAGKSTIIGGILGYYPLSAGSIRFGKWEVGQSLEYPMELKSQIAYIPEQPLYYDDMTLREHMEWKQRLFRLAGRGNAIQDSVQLIHRFQLDEHLDKFPHQCSKGTLQKLMIVSAFMVPFQILIVDEPFIGLDVIAMQELKHLIEECRGRGAAVIISTHVLDSAEKMCNRFVLLENGHAIARGTFAQLREQSGKPEADLAEVFISLLRRENLTGGGLA